ncbi:MAG TPA: CAP domain-containing protein [Burkholderiaceae bacterium]|nr:CAP domain-containing protein [Burkholderiaceae bacterium]
MSTQSCARRQDSPLLPRIGSVVALLALVGATEARADAVDVVNALRRQGCGNSTAPALARAPRLDAAARGVAEGRTLRAAVDASGYRAVAATLLSLEGARDDRELARLAAPSCAQITRAGLRDAGSFQRGGTVWIVLAEPFSVPSLDKTAVAARVLALVNQARAQPRRCGREEFGAASPLRRSPRLEQAAASHALDMAERGTMSHTGHDGSMPAQRVTRTGYSWSAVGENIAAGQRDADAVVESWLESPGHCANLMNPEYSEVGVAFATNSASAAGIYWAQVFAAPLAPANAGSSRGH